VAGTITVSASLQVATVEVTPAPSRSIQVLNSSPRIQKLQLGGHTCQAETEGRSRLEVGAAVQVHLPPDGIKLFRRAERDGGRAPRGAVADGAARGD